MPLVQDSELTALRQMREENMLFVCDFEEMTLIPDPAGSGGKIESWATVSGLTDIPCSVVALNGDETIAAQQIAPSSNAFVIVPWRYGAMLKAKYRVVVRGDIDGVTFVETYGIVYIAVPKTFSVQTTMYARSGIGNAGEPRMALARPGLRAAAAPSSGSSDGGSLHNVRAPSGQPTDFRPPNVGGGLPPI